MSDTQESSSAILAEARDQYTVHDCNECDFRKSCELSFGSDECKSTRKSISLALEIEDDYFTKLLDRIEAAVKREKQPGNAAAMRAALEAARRKARDCYDGGEYLGEGADPGFLQILAIIDAALAAQPRNCDRTKDEAEDLFKERFGRPWTQTEDELAAWLFDTIKENGGNKQ